MSLDPALLDLPTLIALSGTLTNEHLLGRIREVGHPALRISHGYVFQHLIAGPRAVTELAELLGVTQQAASKVVLELEGLGYVERKPDPLDSRVRRVALTALGHGAIERARAARRSLERVLEQRVGARALAATRRTLLALLEITGGLSDVAQRRVRPPSS